MGVMLSRVASSSWAMGLLGAMASCGGKGDETWVPAAPVPADWRLSDPGQNPLGRCVRPGPDGTCAVDPMPAAVSCAAAEAGVEFLTTPAVSALFDFNTAASSLYSYADNSSEFLWPDGYEPALFTGTPPMGTQPAQPAVRCIEPPPAGVTEGQLHLVGGPFREWGGGMGRSLQGYAAAVRGSSCVTTGANGAVAPVDDGTGICPPPDPRVEQVPPLEFGLTLRSQVYDRQIDVREWQGISFWARRGVGSDSGVRIALGDRRLDDDTAYLETEAFMRFGEDPALAPGPSCGRVKECGCRNHRPCNADPAAGGFFCWDPERGDVPPSELLRGGGTTPIVGFEELAPYAFDGFPYHFPYEVCGVSRCDEPNAAFAANVNGGAELIFNTPAVGGSAACQPHTFSNDFTADYCYDAAAKYPLAVAPNAERCGDVWARPVALTEQWEFYKVPFSELRQEGWGKEFPYLDLSRITVVRFTFPVGWVDFWLDDVRFYRAAGAQLASPN